MGTYDEAEVIGRTFLRRKEAKDELAQLYSDLKQIITQLRDARSGLEALVMGKTEVQQGAEYEFPFRRSAHDVEALVKREKELRERIKELDEVLAPFE